jgi:hypothetical protein
MSRGEEALIKKIAVRVWSQEERSQCRWEERDLEVGERGKAFIGGGRRGSKSHCDWAGARLRGQ